MSDITCSQEVPPHLLLANRKCRARYIVASSGRELLEEVKQQNLSWLAHDLIVVHLLQSV